MLIKYISHLTFYIFLVKNAWHFSQFCFLYIHFYYCIFRFFDSLPILIPTTSPIFFHPSPSDVVMTFRFSVVRHMHNYFIALDSTENPRIFHHNAVPQLLSKTSLPTPLLLQRVNNFGVEENRGRDEERGRKRGIPYKSPVEYEGLSLLFFSPLSLLTPPESREKSFPLPSTRRRQKRV